MKASKIREATTETRVRRLEVRLMLNRIDELATKFNLTIVSIDERIIEAVRPDGLTVFFDRFNTPGNQFLNHVRVHESAENVFKAVGMVRGMQISMNYAKNHGGNAEAAKAALLQLDSKSAPELTGGL